jgi:hypothetical protein
MYNIKKVFFLFSIIPALYIGLTLLFEESSNDLTFMVLALDDNPFFSSHFTISTDLQDQQKSDEIADNSSGLVQRQEVRDTCPPKPTSLEMDPRTSESLVPGVDPAPPIQIKVPTLANTGSTLLIEGTGYIPLEQVRVELSVDWASSSPELIDETFYECKIVIADKLGSFKTTLKLPEIPFYTTGSGKYSIIGMESMQEKTTTASFLTSKIGFSFRQ